MSNRHEADLASDLAYVKALAEEGRDTPLVGGIYYVIWGGLVGAAALLVYLHDVGVLSSIPTLGYSPFLIAFIAGWIGSFTIGSRADRKPGARTLGNRTASAVWFAVGICLTGFWLTLMVVHDNFQNAGVPPYFLFNLMFPVAFGFYGVAFYATATAGRVGWLRIIALGALVFAALSLAFMGSVHQTLVGAMGSLCCALLPGLILMRGEPSEVV
ncbi:MAG: hypothetical protein AAGD92_01555 [Pseudomonadota bacterium]